MLIIQTHDRLNNCFQVHFHVHIHWNTIFFKGNSTCILSRTHFVKEKHSHEHSLESPSYLLRLLFASFFLGILVQTSQPQCNRICRCNTRTQSHTLDILRQVTNLALIRIGLTFSYLSICPANKTLDFVDPKPVPLF